MGIGANPEIVARSLLIFLTRFVWWTSLGRALEKMKNSRAPDSLESVMRDPSVPSMELSSISTVVEAELTQRREAAASLLKPVTYGMLP